MGKINRLEGLGDRLLSAREAVLPPILQRDVGMLVGKSGAAVGSWERGITEPSISTLMLLADAYNVDPAWLLGLETTSKYPTTSAHPLHTVPVLPVAALAKWRFADSVGIVQSTVKYVDAAAAAIRVESDAMGQLCKIGDIAIIERHFTVTLEGVYMVMDGKSLVPVMRRLKGDGAHTLFMADDARFPSVFSNEAKAIGKVSEIISRTQL